MNEARPRERFIFKSKGEHKAQQLATLIKQPTNRTSKECSNHTTAMQGNKREIQKKSK